MLSLSYKITNWCEMTIALLASDIPELKTKDGVFIPLKLFHIEIYTNGSFHIIQEYILHIPLQDASLAAGRLTNNQDLEGILVLISTMYIQERKK